MIEEPQIPAFLLKPPVEPTMKQVTAALLEYDRLVHNAPSTWSARVEAMQAALRAALNTGGP